MHPIKALETQSGAMRLLIYLSDSPSYVTKILHETDIPNSVLFRAIDLLEEMKLIKKNIDSSTFPKRNIISLTDKGKKVAKHLKEIEEILEG